MTTRIDVFDPAGEPLDLHFQEYWVKRHAEDPVKGIRFEGVERASPAPGVLDAIARADMLLLCPSNPVVSIGPILAVPGVRDAVAARRGPVVGVSPIVGGAPLAGHGRQADARRRARGLGARGGRAPTAICSRGG